MIKCICTLNNDNGPMVQCDKCTAWLHIDCIEETVETLGETYFCPRCPGDEMQTTSVKCNSCGTLLSLSYIGEVIEISDEPALCLSCSYKVGQVTMGDEMQTTSVKCNSCGTLLSLSYVGEVIENSDEPVLCCSCCSYKVGQEGSVGLKYDVHSEWQPVDAKQDEVVNLDDFLIYPEDAKQDEVVNLNDY